MAIQLRPSLLRAAALCAALAVPAPGVAQTSPEAIAFDRVRDGAAAPAATATEWVLTLTRTAAADAVADLPRPARRALAVAKVRERDPQLTADALVVSALDDAGVVIDWQIVPDPRVVRAESPGPDGLLTGQVLARERVEFRVALNSGGDAALIVVFKPRWRGADWLLEPIAVAKAR